MPIFQEKRGEKNFGYLILLAFLGIVISWIDALLAISGTSPWQTPFLTYIFIFAFFIPMIAVTVDAYMILVEKVGGCSFI